jgi:hypothetical protein
MQQDWILVILSTIVPPIHLSGLVFLPFLKIVGYPLDIFKMPSVGIARGIAKIGGRRTVAVAVPKASTNFERQSAECVEPTLVGRTENSW